jgi:hypothetical protein
VIGTGVGVVEAPIWKSPADTGLFVDPARTPIQAIEVVVAIAKGDEYTGLVELGTVPFAVQWIVAPPVASDTVTV